MAKTKVDIITAAGHTIIIESDEDLNTVATKALELWKQTDDKAIGKGTNTTGFWTEHERALGGVMPEHGIGKS